MADRMQFNRNNSGRRMEMLYASSGARGAVNRELPFVIGVVADLSGHKANRPAIRDRRWLALDRDDFAERMEKIEPTLALSVAGLGEFPLRFRELDDFGPGPVAAQVPAVPDLIHARRRMGQFSGSIDQLERLIADLTARSPVLKSIEEALRPPAIAPPPAAPPPTDSNLLLEHILGQTVAPPSGGSDLVDRLIADAVSTGTTVSRDVGTTVAAWTVTLDRRLSDGVRGVLNHPDFRAMEGTWRGLWQFVRNVDTGEKLKIRLFDASRAELERDFASAPGTLFDKTAEQPFRDGTDPFGLLIAGFEFGPNHLGLLRSLARVGQAAHAPVIAAATPALLGLAHFANMPEAAELESLANGDALAGWREFRASAEARYAALTVPRMMARRPYGKDHTEVEEFSFEELAGGTAGERCSWTSAAWCYGQIAAEAFDREGWFTHTVGVDGGGHVAGLPSFPIEDDDESKLVGPTEVAIPGREAEALSRLGFVPLMAVRGSDAAAFVSARSCRKTTGEDDSTLGELRHLLGVSRIAHYLLTISHLHPSASAAELEATLNDWLSRYSVSDPDNWDPMRQPLLDGRVKVKSVSGRNRIVAALVWPVSDSSAPTLVVNVA